MDLTSNKNARIALFLLRLGLGWVFVYAGLSKILNPDWTAAGYLKGAKTFTGLYQWLASSDNISWVNFANEWGLLLIGLALVFGLLVRYASVAGILMMLLYYFPILQFPKVGQNAYLVDEHIIYSLLFVLFIVTEAGKFWGLDSKLKINK